MPHTSQAALFPSFLWKWIAYSLALLVIAFASFFFALNRSKNLPLPDWMDRAIARDFKRYEKTGISKELLEQSWEACKRHKEFHRYQIVDSKVYGPESRIKVLLEEITDHYSVPDVDFIYYCKDPLNGQLGAIEVLQTSSSAGSPSVKRDLCSFTIRSRHQKLAPIFASEKYKPSDQVVLFANWNSDIGNQMMLYCYKVLCKYASLQKLGQTGKPLSIGIISDSKYCGERELGWRIKIAAENLGWKVFLDEQRGRTIKNLKKLDFVICLLPNNKYLAPNASHFLTLFHPFNYLDEEGKLLPFYERYDGYLLTIKPSKVFENIKKRQIPFYPTVQNVPYKKVALNNLTTMIPVWGNRLNDEKYKKLYKFLSQSGFVKFYGIQENKDIIENGYMGPLPFDGTSVIDILQKHGIVLILHSDIHNQEEIPSSRIFEAAAASVVIISDENPFVKNHFGDSVYYIDTSKSSEKIYSQINRHIETILHDPEDALKRAEKAHKIFVNNFLMTDQLIKLAALYNEIKGYE